MVILDIALKKAEDIVDEIEENYDGTARTSATLSPPSRRRSAASTFSGSDHPATPPAAPVPTAQRDGRRTSNRGLPPEALCYRSDRLIVFVREYWSRVSAPSSRPMPDCLYPPNGSPGTSSW